MKSVLYIFSILFTLNLSFSQTKNDRKVRIKTFTNDSISVNYPKTWKKSGAHGYVFFRPKTISRNSYEDELEHVSVNKNFLTLTKEENIETALKKYVNKLNRFETKKSFKIFAVTLNEHFISKIESTVTYSLSTDTYKIVEYFKKVDDKIEIYRYQMREDLFDKYYDDAMLIINSIEKR